MIRIASPGQGFRHWMDRRKRGELACRIEMLDIEVVQPKLDRQDTELSLLVEELESIRIVLRAALKDRNFEATREQGISVTESIAKIRDLGVVSHLPWHTQESLKWLRYKFRRCV